MLNKRERFKDFSIDDCSDFTEITEFMEFNVDELMILNEKLGYEMKREDFVQLLKKLGRGGIGEEEYYRILEATTYGVTENG